MATVQVDVVSAERSLYSGVAKFVVLPGESGELGILPGHTPLITRIKPGTVRIQMSDATEELVFVAGGITPKLLSLINQSEFRTRFEAKGRFKDFNRRIATFVVTAEQPGLTGCAVYLKQHMAS